MATYSGIKGFTIQSLASDPYASEALAGTWASGGTMNTARGGLSAAGSAPQTAALAFAGSLPGDSALAETYDGTSWTAVNPLTTARSEDPGGMGTQTAALCAGGDSGGNIDSVEEYDGT